VRAGLAELREQMSFPTIDKSFVSAPRAWRRSEDDAGELVPLHALEDLLIQLQEAGAVPSQANIDGWYDGIQRGLGDGIRVIEDLTTTDPQVIAWREYAIEGLRDLIRRAARHDNRWRR